MKIIFTLTTICILSASAVQCQSCFDQGGFNGVEEKLEQYKAGFLGCRMPAFKATLINGTPITNDSLQGKTVFMYFWSLHLGFYTAEIPYLNRLMDTFAGKGIVFLAICKDDSAKWDKRSEKFFHFKHISRSKAVLSKFKSDPAIVIFNKDGRTIFYDNGLTDREALLKERLATYIRIIKGNL